MIIICDVGNSNICFASVKNNQIVDSFRLKTFVDKSFDEYYLLFRNFINEKIDDVLIGSVVPVVTSALNKMFKKYYEVEAKIVGNKIKTGINIIADDPKTVGADLIADVSGASDIFNEGLIIDLGTASKFIYYKDKTLLGVSIAPGMAISMKTLTSSAALLPNFELATPKKVLNGSTIPCLQSGVIYGFSSLVDGMIQRIKKELNKPDLKIIGTGGLIHIVADCCVEKFDKIDDLLTLNGFYNIYLKNN